MSSKEQEVGAGRSPILRATPRDDLELLEHVIVQARAEPQHTPVLLAFAGLIVRRLLAAQNVPWWRKVLRAIPMCIQFVLGLMLT